SRAEFNLIRARTRQSMRSDVPSSFAISGFCDTRLRWPGSREPQVWVIPHALRPHAGNKARGLLARPRLPSPHAGDARENPRIQLARFREFRGGAFGLASEAYPAARRP